MVSQGYRTELFYKYLTFPGTKAGKLIYLNYMALKVHFQPHFHRKFENFAKTDYF